MASKTKHFTHADILILVSGEAVVKLIKYHEYLLALPATVDKSHLQVYVVVALQ